LPGWTAVSFRISDLKWQSGVKDHAKVDVKRLLPKILSMIFTRMFPGDLGENIPVQLDLNNAGTWDVIPEEEGYGGLDQLSGRPHHKPTFDNYHLPAALTVRYNV